MHRSPNYARENDKTQVNGGKKKANQEVNQHCTEKREEDQATHTKTTQRNAPVQDQRTEPATKEQTHTDSRTSAHERAI